MLAATVVPNMGGLTDITKSRPVTQPQFPLLELLRQRVFFSEVVLKPLHLAPDFLGRI